MSKTKNGRLDHYGAKPFEQQLCRTAGVEEVKTNLYTHARETIGPNRCMALCTWRMVRTNLTFMIIQSRYGISRQN